MKYANVDKIDVIWNKERKLKNGSLSMHYKMGGGINAYHPLKC